MTNIELKDELTQLLSVRRLEVSQKIRAARNNGKPLDDNPEYDAAKDE